MHKIIFDYENNNSQLLSLNKHIVSRLIKTVTSGKRRQDANGECEGGGGGE